MKLVKAFGAGLAGAVVLTATHQLLKSITPEAPRMDLMGEEAITSLSDKANIDVPGKQLYGITMAADIISNSLYYTLAAWGDSRHMVRRGTMLGLTAGLGAVYLPKPLGLTSGYSSRTVRTSLLTVAIYTLGGLVSGKLVSMLNKE
jgi:hypothetical protein